MSTVESVQLTREGWEQLHKELVLCKKARDSRLAGLMNVAREAEPGGAVVRHEQQEIDSADRRIAYLEDILSRAIPISAADRTLGVIGVGSRVTVSWEGGEEESYLIVGPPEVDLATNRISYESPVGRALMERSEGEWVEVKTPGGMSRLEIAKVI
ncbi:MAG TPA: GreA/GreB family elongation factor [Chloroflexota bacterium]|nr:GreA/GreB family elongation factor [Chloroflexota bacterium]HEX2987809.1 GreA/GreB family elongation factor [Chloroflexota bacterium]